MSLNSIKNPDLKLSIKVFNIVKTFNLKKMVRNDPTILEELFPVAPFIKDLLDGKSKEELDIDHDQLTFTL